ncbi:MAG TPA: YeeE/YedE family protein [Rhizobium sp.]
MTPYWLSLLGGMLLGVSSVLLLLLNGRIAGISGIVGRLIGGGQRCGNLAFVIGLMTGPYIYVAVFGTFPAVGISVSSPLILVAGLLVGFGTRMGSGCTSGHGIMGLARFSRRSMVATATFLIAGIVSASLTGALR